MKAARRSVVVVHLCVASAAMLIFAACSGGGSTSAARSAPSTQNTNGTLRMTIDAAPAASAKDRRPAFLSPSTLSVSIAITGVATPIVADVGPGAPDCTGTGSTRVCSIPLTAPAGTDTFTVTLYDGPNATGNVLGVGSVRQNVAAGFTVTIVVNGVINAIVVSAAQVTFTRGTAATTALTVTATDSGGNTIVGSYAAPVTLSTTDTTGTFALSTASVTASGQAITLTYSGAAAPAAATISASAPGVTSANTTPQQVTVSGAAPPVRHLYVSSQMANNVSVFDVAADGSISGPSRTIGGAATTIAAPTTIALDSVGNLFVVNYGRDVTVYAPGASGNVAPIRTLAPGIVATQVAIDPADGIEITGQGTGNGSNATITFFSKLSAPANPGTQLLTFGVPYAGRWAASPMNDSMGRPLVSCTPKVDPANNGNGTETCFDGGFTITRGFGDETFDFGVAQPNDNVFRSDGLMAIADGSVFGRGPSVDTYALGPTVASGVRGPVYITPTYSITGGATGLVFPTAIAFDGLGNMYVGDYGQASYQGTVKVYPMNATGDVAPTRTLGGLNFNFGLAIGP